MHGLIEVPGDGTEEGPCVALFGTTTLVDAPVDQTAGLYELPDISLQVGDEFIDQGFGCDATSLDLADYRGMKNLIAGSIANFNLRFDLGDHAIDDIEAVVFGSTSAARPDLLFLLPTWSDGIPAPAAPVWDYSPLDVAPAGLSVEHDVHFLGDVEIFGFVSGSVTETSAEAAGPGTCFIVLGSFNVERVYVGFATFGGPSINLMAGGQVRPGVGRHCDTSEVEAAGYRRWAEVNLLAGATAGIYEAVFVPDELVDTEFLIALDFGLYPDFMEATELDVIPSPPQAEEYALPEIGPPITDGSIEHRTSDGVTFTIDASGILIGDLNEAGTGRCVYVLGTFVGDADRMWAPNFSVLSAGRAFDVRSDGCAVNEVERAGYEFADDLSVSADQEVAFYSVVQIPAIDAPIINALVVGLASNDNATAHAPVIIDSVPPR